MRAAVIVPVVITDRITSFGCQISALMEAHPRSPGPASRALEADKADIRGGRPLLKGRKDP
jgi:hypothetical protein